MDIYATAERRLNAAFRATLPHIDAGCRLFAHFEAAASGSPLDLGIDCRWPGFTAVEVVRNDLSQHVSPIVRIEPALTEADDPDSLAERLTVAATATRAQIVSKPQ